MVYERYADQIKFALEGMPDGYVFGLPDLVPECDSYDSIRKTLSGLATVGYIKRVLPGIYQVRAHPEVDPTPEAVVAAIARNNDWVVIPETEQARYELGLTDHKPGHLQYFCNGQGGSYRYGAGKKFRLVRNTSKFMTVLSYEASLVISAFWDIRVHPVTAAEVYFLSTTLSDETKHDLIENRMAIPARIRPVIEIICGQYGAIAK